MNATNAVPAVVNAISIIEYLSQEKCESATLTEISDTLLINKSTCLRILRTLEAKEYLKFNMDTKKYSLGFRFVMVGEKAKQLNTYLEIATSILEEHAHPEVTFVLAKRTAGNKLMYVVVQEPRLPIRLRLSSETFPIPYAGVGKCFLAFLPENEAKEILDEIVVDGKLPQYTPNTITSIKEFKAQIKKIQLEGIIESNKEFVPDISSVACPILNEQGEIVLALGGYILEHYKEMIDIEGLKKDMKEIARKISKAIQGLMIEI
ncbi:IclR family transcriptional regulator [Neobacillus niacini]|uniref:IclR family transcriptional regulator n=1 Tax=Neobacillus niacini TaxID=86668 RepID=UPI002FFD7461